MAPVANDIRPEEEVFEFTLATFQVQDNRLAGGCLRRQGGCPGTRVADAFQIERVANQGDWLHAQVVLARGTMHHHMTAAFYLSVNLTS